MRVYADTSFLASCYLNDAHHEEALQWRVKNPDSLPITDWQIHELKNAIRRHAGKNNWQEKQREKLLDLIKRDTKEFILRKYHTNFEECFLQSDKLGSKHTETLDIRASDLFHIALARELDSQIFLSFDKKQRLTAHAEGFRLFPVVSTKEIHQVEEARMKWLL